MNEGKELSNLLGKNEVNELEPVCIRSAMTREMIYLPKGISLNVLNHNINACALKMFKCSNT